MKKASAILIFMLAVSCSDAINDMIDDLYQQVPICVAFDSTATAPDGRGWKNAYNNIQDAVAAAPERAEIWVKAGTYILTSPISISKTIYIYGGFNGTESRRKQRSTNNTITTIDQSAFAIQFDAPAKGTLDCFRITGTPMTITSNGTFPSINNCLFDTMSVTSKSGGALTIGIAKATISNCTFKNCSTVTSGNGGAIYANNNATLNLVNCIFSGNIAASNGGAIHAYTNASLYISDCQFINCKSPNATRLGGAIYSQNSLLNISNTYFTGNNAGNGGGAIHAIESTTLNISNSHFIDNSAGSWGGAINSNNSNTTISNNCLFKNNTSTYGGAIYTSELNMTISNNCSFIDNSATNDGGAICVSEAGDASVNVNACKFIHNTTSDTGNGGAIYIFDQAEASSFINSFFYQNAAGNGGGIYSDAQSDNIHTFVNLTFYSNNATNAAGNGGGIYCASHNHSIYNSVFFNNTSSSTSTTGNIYPDSAVTLNNCFYNEGAVGVTADPTTNINSYSSPFVSTTYGNNDFLYPSSIIRDKGSDPAVPSDRIKDLAGNPRIVNGTVDMGAYEWQ